MASKDLELGCMPKKLHCDADMGNREDISESSESEYEDEVLAEKLNELKDLVESNPFEYGAHFNLIKEVRSTGDIDEARKAREKMAEIFPLTEELWLDWFKDEMHLVALPSQKAYVEQLFEKAVMDYMSVRIWIQYCQLAMDGIDASSGIDNVRSIYERAVTAVGLHLTEGSAIWDSYREFEVEILQSYQTLYSVESSTITPSKIEEQISRVDSLFKRQLAVPLLGMERTMQEYEDWTVEPIPDTLDKAYQKALGKVNKCLPLEDALSKAESPKLEEYRSYVELEMKDGDPARIQCTFERSIKDNCLDASLWAEYTDYLDNKLKVASVALPVHERAVRNCPWVGHFWVNYIKALDKCKKDPEQVKDALQKALGCGFTSNKDYVDLWLAYCDCMKHRISSWETDDEKIEELRKSFRDGVNYMEHYFGIEGDKTCILRRYWATVEANFLKNVNRALEIWDAVIKSRSKDTYMWLEYTNFLRLQGDNVSCRRAFQRAVQTNVESPEQLCEAFLMFERAEGTREQLESALQRSEALIKKLQEKRIKEVTKEAEKEAEYELKKEKQKQAKQLKNKQNRKLGMQQTLEGKSKTFDKNKKGDKKRKMPNENQGKGVIEEPPLKKVKEANNGNVDSAQSGDTKSGTEVEMDGQFHKEEMSEEVKERTVFLSNLLFSVNEIGLKNLFSSCGDINEVRIVRNATGRSKGYAYLEFENKTSTEKALLMDRTLLEGRPVFVSPCLDKAKNEQPQFRYALTIDKHTVFVTNIPFEASKEELEEIFANTGEIKEVRIVTNRSGRSKGFAYIEYTDETSASNAVLRLDGQTIKGRPVNVAISKAPPRKEKSVTIERKQDHHAPMQYGSRGRSKTQLAMVPRAIHASKPTDIKQEKGKEDQKKETTMNNDDFRKFLSR